MRVAYQECRWRDDIISGKTTSPVGALGMFQFMPATAQSLGVDPLNVASAADGAARYLVQNKNKFGTWTLALMAYNWGPGNVSKYLAGTKTIPTETANYVAQITGDTGYA
jgi:soluble lytic murein transglycosylase-like protein